MVRGPLFSSLAYATLLIVFSIVGVLFPISSSGSTPRTKEASSASDVRAGKQIFETTCNTCHDQYGNPTQAGQRIGAPNLGSVVQKLSDARIRKQISDGGTYMPGFKGSLKPEQINALVKYVRTFGRNSTAR
jgi:mono/diheme cytochrome c family protein